MEHAAKDKLSEFKMRVSQRMEQISCVDKVTNYEGLQKVLENGILDIQMDMTHYEMGPNSNKMKVSVKAQQHHKQRLRNDRQREKPKTRAAGRKDCQTCHTAKDQKIT